MVFSEGMWRQMRVAHRHLHGLVTEDLLQLEEVTTAHDPLACERVAEIVKRDVRTQLAVTRELLEAAAGENAMKRLLEDASRAPVHCTSLVREHEGARTPQAPLTQDRQQLVEDGHVPDVAAFRRCIEASLDDDEPSREVDVVPAQRGELTLACAREQRRRVQGVDDLGLFARSDQEPPHLVVRAQIPEVLVEDAHLRLLDSRNAFEPPEIASAVQHRDEQREQVRDRLLREVLSCDDEAIGVLDRNLAKAKVTERRTKVTPQDAFVVAAAPLQRCAVGHPVVRELVEGAIDRRRRLDAVENVVAMDLVTAQRFRRGLVVGVGFAPASTVLVDPANPPFLAMPNGSGHGRCSMT